MCSPKTVVKKIIVTNTGLSILRLRYQDTSQAQRAWSVYMKTLLSMKAK